ncbi:MAG: 3-deoxy-manno-octulosonate cytidylyltransferase [Pseudomonadota bacterium]
MSQMTPITIIPARMASTRLPGKPLADIQGEAMIVRVCQRAALANTGPVVVAAAELEVVERVSSAGFEAVLTNPDLPSGSDRVWAALQAFDPDSHHDVIINLQGDMPTIDPSALGALMPWLKNGADIATLAAEITHEAEREDPNVVKIALASNNRALYFSRATIPHGDGPLLHHIGVYGYTRDALRRFVSLPPSPLEQRESLEQLRALEAGMRIDCAILNGEPPNGVDTPADLDAARYWYQERGLA